MVRVLANDELYHLGNAVLTVSDEVTRTFPAFTDTLMPCASNVDVIDNLSLNYAADGLRLDWHRAAQKKPLNYHINYLPHLLNLRSFPAPKQGAFNQALGKRTQTVVDVTGGWGDDAMLMASQGYQVTVLERNPLMALMLQEAFARLSAAAQDLPTEFQVPVVKCLDSITASSDTFIDVDCVYLDPMFPPKRKKSAAVNKRMQLLQWMVGEDLDAQELLAVTLTRPVKRIAVKRPDYAAPLVTAPAQQFSSKLVHYDVYLPS